MVMPDLTPERLWEIVKPVWQKHRGTSVDGLSYWHRDKGCGQWYLCRADRVLPDIACLLCEGGFTRFLAERGYCEIHELPRRDGWKISACPIVMATGPTIIEALAAACLSVPV